MSSKQRGANRLLESPSEPLLQLREISAIMDKTAAKRIAHRGKDVSQNRFDPHLRRINPKKKLCLTKSKKKKHKKKKTYSPDLPRGPGRLLPVMQAISGALPISLVRVPPPPRRQRRRKKRNESFFQLVIMTSRIDGKHVLSGCRDFLAYFLRMSRPLKARRRVCSSCLTWASPTLDCCYQSKSGIKIAIATHSCRIQGL